MLGRDQMEGYCAACPECERSANGSFRLAGHLPVSESAPAGCAAASNGPTGLIWNRELDGWLA
jgi:hypothetical protein